LAAGGEIDLQEQQGRELMVQQEIVKYKEMCQEILNKLSKR
jgi:hypothetical protein